MSNRSPGTQEYLLQGSVLDDSVDILLHRLRGMSDNSEDGLVRFKDHVMVYSMKDPNSSSVVSLRLKRSISSPNHSWTMCYLGHPELGDRSRPTTVRACIEVNCTPNVCSFVTELGFRLEYEYIASGCKFRKNKLRATVSKICKILNPPNLDQVAPISQSHLVEVSRLSETGDERAANEVSTFADQLKPLINLEKKDPGRMQL